MLIPSTWSFLPISFSKATRVAGNGRKSNNRGTLPTSRYKKANWNQRSLLWRCEKREIPKEKIRRPDETWEIEEYVCWWMLGVYPVCVCLTRSVFVAILLLRIPYYIVVTCSTSRISWTYWACSLCIFLSGLCTETPHDPFTMFGVRQTNNISSSKPSVSPLNIAVGVLCIDANMHVYCYLMCCHTHTIACNWIEKYTNWIDAWYINIVI